MCSLTARDALVSQLCRVTEEDRPGSSRDAAGGLYAVFASRDGGRFLGLVSAREVAETPHRIFADLLPEKLPCVVAACCPLEAVLRCMDLSDRWYFPVVDGRGDFLGAVTRARVLEVLLHSHSRLLRENRVLTRRLFLLQERERHRLARELHDELGQYLVALRTDLEHLRLLGAGDSRIRRHVSVIEQVLDHLHDAVRQLVHRLRPELLDQLGLPDTLRELVAEYRRHHPDIAFSLVLAGDLKDLPDDHAIALYRIVQESLTNVVRHADARAVRICLCRHRRCDTPVCRDWFPPSRCRPDVVHLLVRDNGRGLPPDHAMGFGLMGMRERVECLGGTFRLESRPGEGVRVIVELPLVEKDGNASVAPGG